VIARPLARNSDNDWKVAEENLGVTLPSDYKGFIDHYGPGSIDGFIFILSPFSTNSHLNLLNKMQVLEKSARISRQSFGKNLMPPLFPDKNGFIPFGYTENGDGLYWKVDGSPESWKVNVFESRTIIRQEFGMTMTVFLKGLIENGIYVNAFPDDGIFQTMNYYPSE